MSTLFYDRLIDLRDVEVYIRRVAQTPEERAELWAIVDEVIHHKVMGCILDRLPAEDWDEFLRKFHERPHDHSLLEFLEKKIADISKIISREVGFLQSALLG